MGLDNAGKSTLLLALQGESTDNVTTTWGFARCALTLHACRFPRRAEASGLAGRGASSCPAGYPTRGVPPATARQLHSLALCLAARGDG